MLIAFKAKNMGFYVKFNDSPIAQKVLNCLPLDGIVRRRGDELYFETDIALPSDSLTSEVKVGDVAYWPEGKSLCVFFGPTQASQAEKPVPVSPVVIIGSTMATPGELREIKDDEPIRVFVMGKVQNYSQGVNLYDDNKKLSQQEIDILVKQLLEEKRSPQ